MRPGFVMVAKVMTAVAALLLSVTPCAQAR